MKTMLALSWRQRIWVCGLIAATAIAATSAGAQSVTPRIQSEISSSEQATLKGSLHPWAQAKFDAGRVPADTKLNGITMVFNRTAAQQADLDALIAAQQNPASPLYHQWLTPEQFAARFGMAESDLTSVESWLEQQGFSIDSVARSRNLIRFSGTVTQVERAFSTEMHYYKAADVQHFAPSTELSIPAALAPVVLAVSNLSDFRPKPQMVLPKNVRARSDFTSSQSSSVFFAPGDIKTVYNILPAYSSGYTGSGQTIVIVGQSAISTTDIENFQNAAGLTVKDPTLTLVPGTGTSKINPGGTNNGDQLESDLDIEWSGAIATGATINFVYTGSNTNYNVFDSVQYAIDNKLGNIISVSYGDCETDLGSTNAASLDSILAQGVSQGQSIVSASGDSGSTACYGYTNLTTAQQEALAVSYPASSAYVTGVGGTAISQANSAYETQGNGYWTAKSGSDIVNSALQYIPEVVWNDDASSESATSNPGLSAGGGGASAFFTKPSWQKGVTGIPSGNSRYVPDVSLYSSPNYPGYLYCSSDVSTNITGSCSNGFRDANDQYLTIAGGTSFAAPIFAGMVAIINQKAGYTTGQGLVNTELYKLASNSTTYASAFHDITSGSIACTGGSSFCSSSGESGFAAATGYDEATGLGSVNFDNLLTAWASNSLTATTTTLSVSPASASIGASVTLTATLTPSAATGTVTFYDGTTSLGTGTLSSGTTTFTTSSLAVGSHSLSAVYAGDSSYSTSTSASVTLVVSTSSGSTATTTSLAASTTTPSYGASVTFTATVAPSAATGTVYFYDGTTSLGSGTLSSGKATYSTSALTAGTHTITATYGGDTTYASSSSSGITVTVSSPSFKLSASNLTLTQGSQGNTTVTVTPTGYTGTVDITPSSSTASFCYSTTTATVTSTSAATATMTIDTNLADCSTSAAQKGHGMRISRAANGQASLTPHASPSIAAAAFSLAGLFFAGLLGWRRRQLRLLSCLIALGICGFLFSGCGGSSSSNTNYTSKGTYTITLTGQDSTSSSIPSATTTFTLVVD